MRFIKRVNLERDLIDVPLEVKKTALRWLAVIEQANWENFLEVQQTYNSADHVDDLFVFNIQSHRLIVGINFERKIVYYKAILSHAEYDSDHWKEKFSRKKLLKQNKSKDNST